MLPAVLAVAAVALVPATGGGRPKRSACEPGKGVVVQASSRAVVVRRREGGSQDFYACLRSNGRFVSLGNRREEFAGGSGVDFRLAGRFVAVIDELGDARFGARQTLSILDLRKRNGGRDARGGGVPTVTVSFMTTDEAQLSIDTFVLTSEGVAAFAVKSSRAGDAVDLRVLSEAGDRSIDSAPDLVPDSLAVAGRRLYWVKAGVPRSTELRAVPSDPG